MYKVRALLAVMVSAVLYAPAPARATPEDDVCKARCQCEEKRGGDWIGGKCVIPVPTDSRLELNYHVVSLFYSPPGNVSQVRYGGATAIGSRVEFSVDRKVSSIFQIETTVADTELEMTVGGRAGNSVESVTTEGHGYIKKTVSDEIDHWQDGVYLLMKPKLNIHDDGRGNLSSSLEPAAQDDQFVAFTLEQLYFGTGIPGHKQDYFNRLTWNDRLSIARLNPWFAAFEWSGDINFPIDLDNHHRFSRRQNVPVQGPDNPRSGEFLVYLTLDYDHVDRKFQANTHGGSSQVLAGGEVEFIVEFGVKGGSRIGVEYENVCEKSEGSEKHAEAEIGSSTYCWYQNFATYYDAAFGTYAFQPLGAPVSYCLTEPSASGVVVDASGQPVAGATVALTLADGNTAVAPTNEDGVYRLYDLDAAPLAVRVGEGLRAVELAAPER